MGLLGRVLIALCALAGIGAGASAAAADIKTGTSGPDRIVGTAGADRLYGKGGRDVLIGRAGRDVLIGDSGADRATAWRPTASASGVADAGGRSAVVLLVDDDARIRRTVGAGLRLEGF